MPMLYLMLALAREVSNTSILQGPVGNLLRSLMRAGTPTDLYAREWTRQHDVIEFQTFLSRTLTSGAIKGK